MKNIAILFTFLFITSTLFAQSQNLKQVRFAGTPKEIGKQFGETEKDRFATMYQELLNNSGLDSPAKENYALTRIQALEPYIDSASMEEIKGFAEGAGVPYEKVLLINCFYDFFSNAGCRQVVVFQEKSKTGNLIHGRNLDWPDWGNVLRNHNVFLVRKYSTGNAIATFTWPGMLGSLTGCNDKGITIAYNQIKVKQKPVGEPIFLHLRRNLQNSSTLEEALQTIQAAQIGTCGSIMISSCKENKAVVVDLVDGKPLIRHSENFCITSDNTSYFDDEGNFKKAQYQSCPTNTVTQSFTKLDLDDLQKILADEQVLLSINLLTVLFDPENNIAHVSCGKYNAVEGPYEKIEVFATKDDNSTADKQPKVKKIQKFGK